jgi:hypothetical protein
MSCPTGYAIGPTGDCIQTPEFRLQAVLQEYLTAAQLGQYGDPPPTQEQMEQMLSQEAGNICRDSYIPCAASPSSLIAGVGDQYATFLDKVVPEATLTAPAVNLPDGTTSFYNPVYAQTGPYYNPSAGFVAAPGSEPPTLSPTIPAFTSPANSQSTGAAAPGTASGTGSTVTAGTQQTSLLPSAGDAALAGMLGQKDSKLLVILLVVAVAVIIFGGK